MSTSNTHHDDEHDSSTTLANGLTQEERELLADVALYSPELRERDLKECYLLWGKWLVERGKVSEFPEDE